jgi:hypothetical protein
MLWILPKILGVAHDRCALETYQHPPMALVNEVWWNTKKDRKVKSN